MDDGDEYLSTGMYIVCLGLDWSIYLARPVMFREHRVIAWHYSKVQATNSTVNHNATVAVDDLSTDLTAVCASQEDNHSRDLTRLPTTTDGP